jgi:hypothetical protein
MQNLFSDPTFSASGQVSLAAILKPALLQRGIAHNP